MKYGVCTLSVIPLRSKAEDQSEQISQLLFGELAEVLGKTRNWLHIKTDLDKYEGWIDEKQLTRLTEEEYNTLIHQPVTYSADLVQLIHNVTDNEMIPILLGSSIYQHPNHTFTLADKTYSFKGDLFRAPDNAKSDNILKYAKLLVQAPYQWGGRSPFGIDCSGFTQLLYKMHNISLPRDAWQQANYGETISFLSDALPGDLAFFDNNEGKIIHVGIILDNQYIIHASGHVRIDPIDHQGIYNNTLKRYTHQLRLIKHIPLADNLT